LSSSEKLGVSSYVVEVDALLRRMLVTREVHVIYHCSLMIFRTLESNYVLQT
jgi:hypothetical protein